jgi:nucleoid-associated protein YgaU
MRQTARSAGILSLFLLTLTNLSAEPMVRGFFVEKLPKQATTRQLAPGKGLVLAHVFNSGDTAIKAGNYEVGIEIEDAGKKAKYALKPGENISSGSLKTFRMAVPVSEEIKAKGSFRVFSRIDGKMIWSEKYSFLQGVHSSGDQGITTLYTEAPPEPGSVRPPAEIPFENELNKKKTPVQVSKKPEKDNRQKDAKTKVAAVAEKPAVTKNTPIVEKKVAAPARNIDPSEFKKLRTIDEELVIYVIKDGDSLRSIAEKYYGNAAKERSIADLNFIENPSSVKVGEEIIVDVKPLGKSETIKKAISSSKVSQAFISDKKTYTIQRGDTLGKIARQFFGRSSEAGRLIKANPGLNPRNLKIGDVIIIPENKGDNA